MHSIQCQIIQPLIYGIILSWQNMQFWGSGEFALPFGNFEVNITVPADHILEATGTLLNRSEVFTPEQLKRYKLAEQSFDKPVIVVTQAEAEAREVYYRFIFFNFK